MSIRKTHGPVQRCQESCGKRTSSRTKMKETEDFKLEWCLTRPRGKIVDSNITKSRKRKAQVTRKQSPKIYNTCTRARPRQVSSLANGSCASHALAKRLVHGPVRLLVLGAAVPRESAAAAAAPQQRPSVLAWGAKAIARRTRHVTMQRLAQQGRVGRR